MIKKSLMSFVIVDCISLRVACNQAGHVMRLCPGRLSQLASCCHGIQYLNAAHQRDYDPADEVPPTDVTRTGRGVMPALGLSALFV